MILRRDARRTVLVLLMEFAALSLVGSIASGQDSKEITFSLSGIDYRFPLPEGYCIPEGEANEWMDTVALLDTRNMAHFTIVLCAERIGAIEFTKWGILKTPRASIGKRVGTRQSFLRDFRKRINTHEFETVLLDAADLASKTFEEVFGSDSKLGAHMEPVDADEYGGYLAGTTSISFGEVKTITAAVAAMTIVRGHAFFYYRYSTYGSPRDILELLKITKTETRRFVEINSNYGRR